MDLRNLRCLKDKSVFHLKVTDCYSMLIEPVQIVTYHQQSLAAVVTVEKYKL